MLYNSPVKGDDGLYFVKALTDEKRKCFVQLNKVTLADISNEIVFDLNTDVNKSNRLSMMEIWPRRKKTARNGLERS